MPNRSLIPPMLLGLLAASCGGDNGTGPVHQGSPQVAVSFLRSSTYSGPKRLMIADIGAIDPTPITPASENVSPAYSWSPDGQRVAYAIDARGVRIIGRNGSGEHVLAGSDTVPSPTWIAWSPDGRWIAATNGGALWIFPAAGGAPTVVPTSLTSGVEFPVWSRDSHRIAFTTASASRLGVVTVAGPVQIFTTAASHPDWSPDGTEIVIESGPPWGIWTVNADGSSPRPVAVRCQSGAACVDTTLQFPHWSPDGLRFAVHVYPSDVAVIDADGSNLRIVPALRGIGLAFTHPGWSRDGRVLFLANRTGLAKPFVMNADTSEITAVTSGGFYDDVPRWVP